VSAFVSVSVSVCVSCLTEYVLTSQRAEQRKVSEAAGGGHGEGHSHGHAHEHGQAPDCSEPQCSDKTEVLSVGLCHVPRPRIVLVYVVGCNRLKSVVCWCECRYLFMPQPRHDITWMFLL